MERFQAVLSGTFYMETLSLLIYFVCLLTFLHSCKCLWEQLWAVKGVRNVLGTGDLGSPSALNAMNTGSNAMPLVSAELEAAYRAVPLGLHSVVLFFE